jgi:hypothetical protein
MPVQDDRTMTTALSAEGTTGGLATLFASLRALGPAKLASMGS